MTTPMKPNAASLDSAPPPVKTKGSLMDAPQEQGGEGSSPQMQAMLGMGMLEQGIKILSLALPGLAPALQQVVEQLRQAVPQAMNELPGEGLPGGTGGPAPPPPPMQTLPGQQ